MPEIQVNFLGHACAEIICGRSRIITDPWLTGTAFLGGWQRKFEPPDDWKRRLATAELVYISHSHSDHMSRETMRHYDGNTVIPGFQTRSAEKEARRQGIRATAIPMGKWHTLQDCRFMILPDTSGRDDSALLVEYRGKYLLNVVDCNMPNGLELPEQVEWLLAPWSTGASPYPVCYREMYGPAKTRDLMDQRNAAAYKRLCKLLKLTNPQYYMPFAGYYVETDEAIRAVNRKNPVFLAVQAAIDHGAIPVEPKLKLAEPEVWQYELCPFTVLFDSGYKGDRTLVLNGMRHYFAGAFAPETHIDVDQHILNYVLSNRIPWDEMTIGFHCKLSRTPDVYEADFWSHFQDHLPEERPWATRS